MALGATPSLTQINTELGVSGQSLSQCIVLAGKSGVWYKQSDFANFTYAAISGDVAYMFFGVDGTPSQFINITAIGYGWTITHAPGWANIVPSTGSAGITNVEIYCGYNADPYRSDYIRFYQGTSGLYHDLTIDQAAES